MIRHPRIGQSVNIRYAKTPKRRGVPAPADVMPWQGQCGTVVAVGNGRGPRNAAVRIDGTKIVVVVPRGNLQA